MQWPVDRAEFNEWQPLICSCIDQWRRDLQLKMIMGVDKDMQIKSYPKS